FIVQLSEGVGKKRCVIHCFDSPQGPFRARVLLNIFLREVLFLEGSWAVCRGDNGRPSVYRRWARPKYRCRRPPSRRLTPQESHGPAVRGGFGSDGKASPLRSVAPGLQHNMAPVMRWPVLIAAFRGPYL